MDGERSGWINYDYGLNRLYILSLHTAKNNYELDMCLIMILTIYELRLWSKLTSTFEPFVYDRIMKR